MKKLMIALGAVALAVGAQAANVTWGSGAVYIPAIASEKEGVPQYMKAGASSSTGIPLGETDPVSKYVQAFVFEYAGTESDWLKYDADNSKIWADFNMDEQKLNGQAVSKAGGTGGSGQASLIGTKSYGESDFGHGVLIYTWDSNQDGTVDYYIAKTVSTDEAVGSGKSLANLAGTTATNAGGVWTAAAVPEPTSAMLLLLGMAGLALRRRRA